ncbi:hypothetical protein GSI_09336 [Ganoderma sinense ZZ0214-1]|uniref:Uncharacterized protein n=1 Tax=Ganoderma sinense ZZ0214-1 TaxID=1077348 RepID=A0A2G8S6A9_9APHY|nr:hypothetical protein GSI_09336 [Ganoderma sinense ZZ0214-1]
MARGSPGLQHHGRGGKRKKNKADDASTVFKSSSHVGKQKFGAMLSKDHLRQAIPAGVDGTQLHAPALRYSHLLSPSTDVLHASAEALVQCTPKNNLNMQDVDIELQNSPRKHRAQAGPFRNVGTLPNGRTFLTVELAVYD